MTSGPLYSLLQLVQVYRRSENPCHPWLDAMESQGPDPCPSAIHYPSLLLSKTLARTPWPVCWSHLQPSRRKEMPVFGKHFTNILEDLCLWESRLELNYTSFRIGRWDRPLTRSVIIKFMYHIYVPTTFQTLYMWLHSPKDCNRMGFLKKLTFFQVL